MIKFEGNLLRCDLIEQVTPIKHGSFHGIRGCQFTIKYNSETISLTFKDQDDAQASYEELEAQIFDYYEDNSKLADIEKRLEAIERCPAVENDLP